MERAPAHPGAGGRAAAGAARSGAARPSVRTRRIEYGLTLAQLAVLCGDNGAKVSASEISRIERRIHSPRPGLRKVLADLLGLPVGDI